MKKENTQSVSPRKFLSFSANIVKFYFRGGLEVSVGANTLCESLRIILNTTTKRK